VLSREKKEEMNQEGWKHECTEGEDGQGDILIFIFRMFSVRSVVKV